MKYVDWISVAGTVLIKDIVAMSSHPHTRRHFSSCVSFLCFAGSRGRKWCWEDQHHAGQGFLCPRPAARVESLMPWRQEQDGRNG